MAALRVIIGSSLAMLLPVINSMVAERTASSELGWMFGRLASGASIGSIVTVLLTVAISEHRFGGILGWRLAQAVVGALSLLAVPLVQVFVQDGSEKWCAEKFGLSRELQKLKKFCQIGTYRVLILQGMFGTIPGAAGSFFTMYMQYLGINNILCGAIAAMHQFGDAFGSVIGGHLGDVAYIRSPNYGRTCVAILSLVLSIPFLYVTLQLIPMDASYSLAFAAIQFLAGLTTTWEVPACINPYVIDIMPSDQLSSAFSWEVAIVFASGTTLGPILAGFMIEDVFDYEPSNKTIANMSSETRDHNAHALRNGIFYSCLWPCLISLALFCVLFKTYPEDQDSKQRKQEVDEAESATETTGLLSEKEV